MASSLLASALATCPSFLGSHAPARARRYRASRCGPGRRARAAPVPCRAAEEAAEASDGGGATGFTNKGAFDKLTELGGEGAETTEAPPGFRRFGMPQKLAPNPFAAGAPNPFAAGAGRAALHSPPTSNDELSSLKF